MTRAMQKDGLKSVDFTVSGGTKVSAKSGKPLQNALHFRADYMNPHSGDDITVWGSIEAKQYGTQPVKARREFTTNEEFQDYTRKVQAVRERAAAPYVDPQSPQAAAKLLRAKYGTNRFYSSDIQMRDGKEGVAFAINTPGGHARMLSNGNGVCIGKEPADAEGFASMFNNGKSPANRITADNVKSCRMVISASGRTAVSRSTLHPCPLPAGLVAATENLRLQRGRRFHGIAESLTLGKCRVVFYFPAFYLLY